MQLGQGRSGGECPRFDGLGVELKAELSTEFDFGLNVDSIHVAPGPGGKLASVSPTRFMTESLPPSTFSSCSNA